VRADIQGRVFGLRQTLASASLSLGFLVAGQLADHLAGPRGALAAAIRPWVGGAAGAGIGLVISAAGLATILMAALAAATPLGTKIHQRGALECTESP
jgi:DHA3 family macrolide efflux protein-like MFS transporter